MIAEKVKTVILPAFLVSGLGVLAIRYPHFLDDFEPHYIRANDLASLILVVLFFVLAKLAWTQIGGAVAIAISQIIVLKSLWPKQPKQSTQKPINYQPVSEPTQKTLKQEAIALGLHSGAKVGEHFIRRRRRKRNQEKNDSSQQ